MAEYTADTSHQLGIWKQQFAIFDDDGKGKISNSTGYSPYFMMHHRQPRLPLDVEFLPNHNLEDDNVEEFLSTMLKIKDEIKDKASVNITKAQSKQKEYFDR